MFGRNEVTAPFQKEDGSLLVNDIWYTIQGEGPDQGRPAVFLRLSKCHLQCVFCDTEFETGKQMTLVDVIDRILQIPERPEACKLLVITGGEPLLQNFLPLVDALNSIGWTISVETAGAMWLEGLADHFAPDRSIRGNLIVCSPKTRKCHPKLVELIGAYKYVVSFDNRHFEDGLPVGSTQWSKDGLRSHLDKIFRRPINSNVPIFVQPMDEQDPTQNDINLKVVTKIALEHGYRLGYQLHKLVGVA